MLSVQRPAEQVRVVVPYTGTPNADEQTDVQTSLSAAGPLQIGSTERDDALAVGFIEEGQLT